MKILGSLAGLVVCTLLICAGVIPPDNFFLGAAVGVTCTWLGFVTGCIAQHVIRSELVANFGLGKERGK